MSKERVIERLKDYENALNRLIESTQLQIENSIIVDGVIQRFEFTFELGWKLMKDYLEYEGIQDAQSPRSTIRSAFKFGLIKDGDAWINMMIDRNKTSHTYDEKQALEIYNNIKQNHIILLENLLGCIKERV